MISEAEDVVGGAQLLRRWLDTSYADGTITAAEVMEGRVLIEQLFHESQETVVAAQWTDAGERRAWGELAGGPAPRLEHYERQIIRLADEIGYELGRIIPFPRQHEQPTSAA